MVEDVDVVGEVAGQAVSCLRGYAYQLYESALAWISLKQDECLFLEVAEDYAVATTGALKAVQVKNSKASITLNSPDVIATINAFFALKRSNPTKAVSVKYLTTAKIGLDREVSHRVCGRAGLDYWIAVQKGSDVEPLRKRLLEIDLCAEAREFLANSSGLQITEEFICRLHWLADASSIEDLRSQLADRVVKFGEERGASSDVCDRMVDPMIAKVLEMASLHGQRKLDRADFLRLFDKYSRVSLPISSLDAFMQIVSESSVRTAHRAKPYNTEYGRSNSSPVSNLPYRVPIHFLGREEALDDLEELFTAEENRLVAVFGPQGVGKTTLASAYGERQKSLMRVVWWIRADSAESMKADLQSFGLRLGWVMDYGRDQDEICKTVLERLGFEGAGILIIYDGAQSCEQVRPFLPKSGAAKVLVTSNSHAWRSVGRPYDLRAWSTEIGSEYLVRRTGFHEQREDGAALSRRLGDLPLALEQAAAYCEQLGVSFSEYLRRFELSISKMLSDKRYAPADYRDQDTIMGTVSLAINEATKIHPAAEQLIVYASWLAPNPIPLFFFSNGALFLRPLESVFSNRIEEAISLGQMLFGDGLDEAVAALRGFALVDRFEIVQARQPGAQIPAIQLHALVRDIARTRWSEDQLPPVRAQLRAAMSVAIGSCDPKFVEAWPFCDALLPHMDVCARLDADATPFDRSSAEKILSAAAKYRHIALGAFDDALRDTMGALALFELQSGPDHFHSAGHVSVIASILHSQGKLQEAKAAYEKTLWLIDKFPLIFTDLLRARSQNGLGLVLLDRGELSAARSAFDEALAGGARFADEGLISAVLNNIGLVLREQGNFDEALRHFKAAVDLMRSTDEPNAANLSKNINNLALIYEDLGRLPEALKLFEEALEINLDMLGDDHPDTAMSLDNLAGVHSQLGNYAESLRLQRQALAIREARLPADHPHIALSLNAIGCLMLEMNDLDASDEVLQRAYSIRDGRDSNNPNIVPILTNLAVLRTRQGKLDDARSLLARALRIREQRLGSSPPLTMKSAKDLNAFDEE